MRLKLNLIIVFVGLALASLTMAQGGGGQGRRGGGRGPNYSIAGLIMRSEVQTELALTDDEKSKIEAMADTLRPPRRQQGDPQPTAEERMAREKESAAKVEAVLTPDQIKRLHEIQIQVMGPMALERPEVQTDLGLSADQVSKLKELFKGYQEANRSVMSKVQDGSLQRQDAFASMQKNSETLKADAAKVLTADQSAKFTAMGGKPFSLPQGGGRGRGN